MSTAASSTPLPPFATRVGATLELRLKVVPGASRSAVAGVLGDRLKVRVAAAPEDGKANRMVITVLSEWLAGASVELISGHTSPLKLVRIADSIVLPAAGGR